MQFIYLQEVGRLIPLLNAVPYDLTLTSKTRNDFVVSRGNVPNATPKRQHICNCFSCSPRLQRTKKSLQFWWEGFPISHLFTTISHSGQGGPLKSFKSSLQIAQKLNNGPIHVTTSVFQVLPLKVSVKKKKVKKPKVYHWDWLYFLLSRWWPILNFKWVLCWLMQLRAIRKLEDRGISEWMSCKIHSAWWCLCPKKRKSIQLTRAVSLHLPLACPPLLSSSCRRTGK